MEVGDPEWPVLDEEAFHGPAGEVVRAIEPNTESDPAGLLATFIAAVGNVIGRGAHFQVEEDLHYCKIWPVLVGETAKGRKGTAHNRIKRLMNRVDQDWYEGCIVTGLSSGEGVIERLRDSVVGDDGDGQLEVTDPGAADKRLLVEEPEFGSPLTVMQREGNTLSMVVRNLWDDRPLQTMTRNSPLRATDTHGTIIGHVTRERAPAAPQRGEAWRRASATASCSSWSGARRPCRTAARGMSSPTIRYAACARPSPSASKNAR